MVFAVLALGKYDDSILGPWGVWMFALSLNLFFFQRLNAQSAGWGSKYTRFSM